MTLFRRCFVLLSVLFLPSAQSQCSVCGDGKQVTAPDAIFAFPGEPAVDCATLELAGELGAITDVECSFLPDLITICECAPR